MVVKSQTKNRMEKVLGSNIANNLWKEANQHAVYPGPGEYQNVEPQFRQGVSRAKLEKFIKFLYC